MGYVIPEKYRPGAPPGDEPEGALSLEWTGTAGFRLTFGGETLLVDPFVTRPRLPRAALLRLPVNAGLCAGCFPRADHIVVGHSHYDHLMDVPEIARGTGATVHGSASTGAVCRAAGLDAARVDVVKPWAPLDCGAFRVTFVPSIHGKAFLGRVPLGGEIAESPRLPMKISGYRHGGTFGLLIEAGGFRLYHAGSADMIDGEVERAGRVDVLLLGLAGRAKTPDYLERMTQRLRPKFIVPHHYDNFFSPLKHGPRMLRGIHIETFFAEAAAVCPDVSILMPGFFERVVFGTAAKDLARG